MSTTTVAKNPKDQTIVDGFWIKSGVINKIKDRIGGFKTKDAEGNEIYKSFDITDAEVRKHMDDFTRSTQMQLHGKIAENADYDLTNYKGVEKLDKLREQHKKEQAEMWDNSQVKRGVDYVTEGVNSAIDTVSGYISHNNYTNVPLREPEKLSKGEYRDRIIKTMEFAMNELGMTKEQAAGLAGNRIGTVLASDNNRRTSPLVAGRDNAVFCQQEHRAGSLDTSIHILDTLYKVLSLDNEQGYQLRLIGLAGAKLGKMHVLLEQLSLQFDNICNLGHRDNGKTSQMGVQNDRLRIRIADNTDTGIPLELVQFIFKLRTEISTFQIVDGAVETVSLPVVGGHTATFRS